MRTQTTLKNALTLGFVIVGILPIVISGFFVLQVLTRDMEREIAQRNMLLARSLAREVERFVSEPMAVLGHAAEVVANQSFLPGMKTDVFLESVKTYYGLFNMIQIIDWNGVVRHACPLYPETVGLDLSGQPFFKQTALSRQTYFSRVFVSMQTGQPTLVVTRPFESGMLAGYLNLASLNSLTDRSSIRPSGHAAIVDRDGTYIAHPDRRLVSQRVNVNDFEPVRRGLAGELGTFRYDKNGVDTLSSIALVPRTKWLVVVMQPAEEAFSPVNRSRTIFGIGAAVAALFALSVAFISLKRAIGPVSRLLGNVKRIAAGDYAIATPPESYREIDELADGFRIMAEAVDVRERALRESEMKYRLLVDNINDFIVEFTPDRSLRFVSPSYCQAFGREAEELLGKDFMELVHREDRWRISQSLEVVRRPPHTAYYEERAMTPGGVRWIAWSARAILNDNGEIDSVISVGRDITEQRRAQEQIRRSEKKFRDLFNSINDLLYTQDLEGRFTTVNAAMVRTFGYSEEELIGRRADEFMKEELRPYFESDYLEALKRDGFHEGISRYTAKNGQRIYIEYRSSLVRFPDREPYISGTGRDVTERMAAERQIRQLQEEVIQAKKMEAIGTLAGGIAHDFNNLLMGIQGNVSLMLLESRPMDAQYDRLKGMERYVRSGADLTRQLLGFARGGKYEVKPIDPNDLVRQSAELFGRTRKEIEMRTRFQEGVWSIQADRSQLEQVLLNLFVNAWQSMPSGGTLFLETENVELAREETGPHNIPEGRFVRIRVKDTGVGMSRETRERVFEPFFTSKKMGRGTGLGLASAYGIVKNHGGLIRVESKLGRGSTFTLDIPASKHAAKETEQPEQELRRGTGTILLVDDEDMVLEVGTEMLSRLGYQTISARSGAEAVALFEQERDRIDLVILDLVMPGLGGGEVYDRLQEIDSEVRVLISSGYSVDGQAQAVLDRGGSGFIQKPFDLQSLSRKVRDIVSPRTTAETAS
ncbi:MAG: PAS domain S-box protein [Deltaproteobacteria bacterium]|nr:PAS domain S-box protein [Deltaproteobacteria bacterium]